MKYILFGLIIIGFAVRIVYLLKGKKPSASESDHGLVAQVMCGGTKSLCPKKYKYDGVTDCAAVTELFDGTKDCTRGCVGLGSCVAVCPEKAIHIIGNIAAVDRSKCNGCGECVKACPKGVITLIERNVRVWIGCNAQDDANRCAIGCDGCGECIDFCSKGAVSIVQNRAVIDYSICDGCGECVKACSKKSIWKATK